MNMSIPNKMYWFLGYNNLGFILEQERKHWLMKTNKKKQIQDKHTGDMFQGQIDNIGSDVIVETEKLPYTYKSSKSIKFLNPAGNKILDIEPSALTYSSSVNGLMFTRILSTSFPLNVDGEIVHKNYKIKFKKCSTCIIPFGGSINTPDVFAGEWIKTNEIPSVMMMDQAGKYTIEKTLEFVEGVTNVTYYFPLSETLQPVPLNKISDEVYETYAINDDNLIGYPLFWFTCDQTNIGPTLSFTYSNTNDRNEQLVFIANEGNALKYYAKLYFGIDGENNATPTGNSTSEFIIRCNCKSGNTFTGDDMDKNVELDPSTLRFVEISTGTEYPITISSEYNFEMTLSFDNPNWTRTDDTAEINLSEFDSNCIKLSNSPMISAFNIHFDETVPFVQTTSDVGYAGIRMSSSNITSDVYDRYPHNLNKWDGLPEWINNSEEGVPQHLAIYAVHNTPTYVEDMPDSRQVSALLLDPGKIKESDEYTELLNDERGRVYVLSNDDTSYENNKKAQFPKPARTVARICDVPTSVMQLSGITGLSPTAVVDPKYVHTEASFTVEDKDRLYNTIGPRWVRPTAFSKRGNGEHVNDESAEYGETNDFVFNSVFGLENVDMLLYNDFRRLENINPMVDPHNVILGNIKYPGVGYKVDDIGVVMVGGFAFNYIVSEVDESGGVLNLQITPSHEYPINLSNFNMEEDNTGYSEEYGTSPLGDSVGTGLKFRFFITNYRSIIPYKGEIFDDLFALVKERDGLWLYKYVKDKDSDSIPKTGQWVKDFMVSEFEKTDTNIQENTGVATSESYINSIIPSIRILPIVQYDNGLNPVSLKAFVTSSFVNIIDKELSPITPTMASDESSDSKVYVDMCKFYCDSIITDYVDKKSNDDVLELIKNKVKVFDCYVIWRWGNSIKTPNGYEVIYGIIRRSFNNLMSNDTTSVLPYNDLKYNRYVHSNMGSTVVWHTDEVGTMLWVYNPECRLKETYMLDSDTQDLHVSRENTSWRDIDFRSDINGSQPIVPLVSDDGVLNYNIITNNPAHTNVIENPSPIYQQPDFIQLKDLQVGNNIDDIDPSHNPTGNWTLVFPRVERFTFENKLGEKQQFVPVKLQAIRGTDLGPIENVINDYGRNVNSKSLVIDETSDGIKLKVFNEKTGLWHSI